MSKFVKVVLITGAVLVGVGILVLLIAGFASNWNFTSSKWEDKLYVCDETDAFVTTIDIDFAAGTLNVQYYDGDVIKVEYAENDQITTEIRQVNNTLKI